MSSPLDRIEAIAELTLDRGGVPDDPSTGLAKWLRDHPVPEDAEWLPYEETWYPLAQSVLALVNVAKAAEEAVRDWERQLPRSPEGFTALREALAALGKEPT